MKTTQYPPRKLRLLLIFLASVYIVIHGRFNELFRALTSLSFYIAVTISFAIGLMIGLIVHRSTLWLDKRCGWATMPVERAILQVTMGVILPSVLDIFLIALYFQSIGQDIFKNQFFLIDFPVILGFILLMNLVYFIYYILFTSPVHHMENQGNAESKIDENRDDSDDYTDRKNDEKFSEEELYNILVVQRVGKKVFIVTRDRREAVINHTITSFSSSYPAAGYIQINRGTIIRKELVADYTDGQRRDNLQVVIDEDFKWILDGIRPDQLQVTKDYINSFKNNFPSTR